MAKNFKFCIAILIFTFFILNLPGFAQNNEEELISEEPLPPEAEEIQGPTPAPKPVEPAQVNISKSENQNKISLDIKGMDVVDVLKMLAQRSGMNIVVGKNVTGRVTLFLKDVDIWDAFEIILLANDLAYEKKGDIINVMSQRDYELLYGERFQDKKQACVIKLRYAKAADLSRALNQIKTNLGRIVVDEGSNTLVLIDTPDKIKEMEDFIKTTDLLIQTRVFSLNYAQADKLSPKIQEALTKGIGSLKIDERTNKIAVTDYPEKLDEVANVISAFDEKTQQVLIDAQIIQIQPSDEFKMGVDWNYWIEKNLRLAQPLPGGSGVNLLKIGMAAKEVTDKEVTDLDTQGQYKTIIDMLRTIGDTQILSSPRIVAMNNQEAKILVGKKQSYGTSSISQGGSGNTVTAIDIKEVESGIKLYVTPTINRDGFVTMKIKPEISVTEIKPIKVGGQDTSAPDTTTSESETTVMVKDGVTIIIGGLKKETRTKSVVKIPVIGDIPYLGYLFRKTSDTMATDELVILITPHILSGENSYSDFSEIKPKDGAIAKMVKGKIITEKITSTPKKESSKDTTSEYYNLVADKVRSLAFFEQSKSEKGEIRVIFTLSEDGNLADEPRILQTSNSALDQFALRAVKDASPFPPFPKELEKKEESFRITLEYK